MDTFEIWDNWDLLLSRMKEENDAAYDKLMEIQSKAFLELKKGNEDVAYENNVNLQHYYPLGDAVCGAGEKSILDFHRSTNYINGMFFLISYLEDLSAFPHCVFINIIGRIENIEGTPPFAQGNTVPFICHFDEDSIGAGIFASLLADMPLFYSWIKPKAQKAYSPLFAMVKTKTGIDNEDLNYFNLLKDRLESDADKQKDLALIYINALNEMHNSRIMWLYQTKNGFARIYAEEMTEQEKLDIKLKITQAIGCRNVTEISELELNTAELIDTPAFQVNLTAENPYCQIAPTEEKNNNKKYSYPYCAILYIQSCLERYYRSKFIQDEPGIRFDCAVEIIGDNKKGVVDFKNSIDKLAAMYPNFDVKVIDNVKVMEPSHLIHDKYLNNELDNVLSAETINKLIKNNKEKYKKLSFSARLALRFMKRGYSGKDAVVASKLFILALVITTIFLLYLSTNYFIPQYKYNKALNFFENKNYADAAEIFGNIKNYKDSAAKSDESNYLAALVLFGNGEYAESAEFFGKLSDYMDSSERYKESSYRNATVLFENGEYDASAIIFGKLNEYKDSSERYKESSYLNAIDLLNTKDYIKAMPLLLQLDDYRDSRNKFEEYKMAAISNAKIGDKVYYGHYDNDDISNGKEVIEWLVVKVESGKALLISEKCLDCEPYNRDLTDVTWETCSLRKWLNSDFMNAAFSDSEQAVILTTELINSGNREYGTKGGNNTKDKIFLLSLDDVNGFLTKTMKDADATYYAQQKGAKPMFGLNSSYSWWLRSPGNDQKSALYIYHLIKDLFSNGSAPVAGSVFGIGVRPAMWFNLSQ